MRISDWSSDVCSSDLSVSNVLFELLAAGALSAVLVPTFVDLLDQGDDEGAEEVAGGVLGVAVVVLGVVSLVGIVAAPLMARALQVGVPADTVEDKRGLITHLLRFFVTQVVLYTAGPINTEVPHAKTSGKAPALTTVTSAKT